MKKHVKVYHDYFDYYYGQFIACENCTKKAVDIHHLTFKSQLGKDEIDNLMALCRDCHNKAHDSKDFNEQLKQKHNEYISNRPRQ
jgi:5-methylcytosine-specific restriction endonuclease McrA